MSQFSLNAYQQSLSELMEEMRKYGNARESFSLAGQSLATISQVNKELAEAQESLQAVVRNNTEQNEHTLQSTLGSLSQLEQKQQSIVDQIQKIEVLLREVQKDIARHNNFMEERSAELATALSAFREAFEAQNAVFQSELDKVHAATAELDQSVGAIKSANSFLFAGVATILILSVVSLVI